MKSYRVIAKIMKGNKRIGFQLLNENNKAINVNENQLRKLIDSGKQIDIAYDKRGFKLKGNRKISELPEIKESKQKEIAGIHIYTGEKLREFVQSSGVTSLKHRDFVKQVGIYCNNLKEKRILAISGLRGTGKTTGLLQAIEVIQKYENTAFIIIDESCEINVIEIMNILQSLTKIKYVFIDESTRIRNLIKDSGTLYDNFTLNGKKLVLSGTDSLSLVKAKSAGLYHRVISINVTHISYAEAKRTLNQNIQDYIKIGGLYENDAIKTKEELKEYIDTAVVDNIINTITKNDTVTNILGLTEFNNKADIQKLRTLIFRIIYAIVYCNASKNKNTSITRIINLFETNELYDVQQLNELICIEMNIAKHIDVDETQIQLILNSLVEIGLIVEAQNIYKEAEKNYYITNPSINTQLLKSIIRVLKSIGLERKEQISIKGIQGLLFESIIVVQTHKEALKLGYNIYYYRDNQGREIDLIIEKSGNLDEIDKYIYYEIKMTSDSDIASIKSIWLNNEELKQFGKVINTGIIYNGKHKIFKEFEDKEAYPPKNFTLEQIENQNKGTELINAEDYLLNISKFIKRLEDN